MRVGGGFQGGGQWFGLLLSREKGGWLTEWRDKDSESEAGTAQMTNPMLQVCRGQALGDTKPSETLNYWKCLWKIVVCLNSSRIYSSVHFYCSRGVNYIELLLTQNGDDPPCLIFPSPWYISFLCSVCLLRADQTHCGPWSDSLSYEGEDGTERASCSLFIAWTKICELRI